MPSQEFEAAAEAAKGLPTTTSNDDLLALYSLYKQATVGDCDTKRPGTLDFKGKAKWDAWDAKKGMAKEEAEKQYIALVKKLSQ